MDNNKDMRIKVVQPFNINPTGRAPRNPQADHYIAIGFNISGFSFRNLREPVWGGGEENKWKQNEICVDFPCNITHDEQDSKLNGFDTHVNEIFFGCFVTLVREVWGWTRKGGEVRSDDAWMKKRRGMKYERTLLFRIRMDVCIRFNAPSGWRSLFGIVGWEGRAGSKNALCHVNL